MIIEHLGMAVPNPIKMGKWFEKNLGFRIIRELGTDVEGVIFMADDRGNVLEIANIPEIKPMDFKSMNPLLIHLAIECADPMSEAKRLVAAGAEWIGEAIRNDYKGEKILVRDPYGGLTIQLVNRQKALKQS